MNKVKITLHGDVWGDIRRQWNLAVISLGESMRAIEVNSKHTFYKHLLENDKKGIQYQIVINGKAFESAVPLSSIQDIALSELSLNNPNLKSIDIVPVIQGGDNDVLGILTVVLGVVLIAVGAVLSPFSGGAGLPLIIAGIGLIAGGVAALLAKAPDFEDFRDIENSSRRPSYFLNGPENIVGEGGPVPLGYGRLIVGSQVVSQSISVRNEAITLDQDSGGAGSKDSSWGDYRTYGNWYSLAPETIGLYTDGNPLLCWRPTKKFDFASWRFIAMKNDGFGHRLSPRAGAGSVTFSGKINAILTNPSDGNIFVTGWFTGVGVTTEANRMRIWDSGFRYGIAKLNALVGGVPGDEGWGHEYTINTFNTNTLASGGIGTAFAQGADAGMRVGGSGDALGLQDFSGTLKLLVGGTFIVNAANDYYNIIRYMASGPTDGEVDATFNQTDTKALLYVDGYQQTLGIHVYSDNSFLAIGNFPKGIAKFDANGNADATFNGNIGTGADGIIFAVAVSTGGDIFIAGSFRSFDGNDRKLIAKLNSTGTLNTTFNADAIEISQASSMYDVKLDSAERVLIAGDFTVRKDGDFVVRGFDRLNAEDGSPDPVFLNDTVRLGYSILVRKDLAEPGPNSDWNSDDIADPLNDDKIYVDGYTYDETFAGGYRTIIRFYG
jgi:predicted phage tail protein